MRKDERKKYKTDTVKKIDEYNKQYERDKYDKFQLVMPKGDKARYKRIATRQGLSMNKFFLMTADDWIERNCK